MFSFHTEIDPGRDPRGVMPFQLMREHVLPALEKHRATFEAMYAPVIGRPEVDPVKLAAINTLQLLCRLSDIDTAEACRYDVRWELALGEKPPGFHSSTLSYFRGYLRQHENAHLAFKAGLEAMRKADYLKQCHRARVDSTHLLADAEKLSRLQCVRETLRLALRFLSDFDGAENWEPWRTRYSDPNPKELRNASVQTLRATLDTAGVDARDLLAKLDALGDFFNQFKPVALLRRVFGEQFEMRGDTPAQRDAAPPGAVVNPHEPEAQWSTKATLGKAGWQGYKVQVCETIPEKKCEKGEPTPAVITAIVVQEATRSDHGSLGEVRAQHIENTGQSLDELHADAGYNSAPALLQARAGGYELVGPMPAPPHSGKRFGSDAFDADLPNKTARCPSGHASGECSTIHDAREGAVKYFFRWRASDCAACALRAQCLSRKNPDSPRTLEVGENHMLVQERRRLCQTDAYKERLKQRPAIEGTHSELARGYRFRRCRYRGLKRTQLQGYFTGAACNLRRWAARLVWEARQKR